jgi:hypothetical protein
MGVVISDGRVVVGVWRGGWIETGPDKRTVGKKDSRKKGQHE